MYVSWVYLVSLSRSLPPLYFLCDSQQFFWAAARSTPSRIVAEQEARGRGSTEVYGASYHPI